MHKARLLQIVAAMQLDGKIFRDVASNVSTAVIRHARYRDVPVGYAVNEATQGWR